MKIHLIIAVTVHFHPEFLKSPVQLNKAKPGIRSQRNRERWTNCIVQVLQHLHRSKIMSIYLRKGRYIVLLGNLTCYISVTVCPSPIYY